MNFNNSANYPQAFETDINKESKPTYFDINKFNAAFEANGGAGQLNPNVTPNDFVTKVKPVDNKDKPIPKNQFDEMLKARMEEHKSFGLTDHKKGKHTE